MKCPECSAILVRKNDRYRKCPTCRILFRIEGSAKPKKDKPPKIKAPKPPEPSPPPAAPPSESTGTTWSPPPTDW